MKDNSLSDTLKGKANKTKGEIKDQVGNATDNTRLQVEGKLDKTKGKAQEKLAEAKESVHDNMR